MMKNVINKNSGVTLVSLAIAVSVILILTGVIIYNIRDNLGISNLREMQSDIQNLKDLVSNYYAKNGQIPARLQYTNAENIEKIRTAGVISEKVDIGKFYIIDLDELENLTLNYGEDYKNISDATTEDEASQYEDIYIINETSQNIFYVEGIQLDGEMFYTDYTSEDVDKVAVNLRYFDGVKIPDGYIYNSGTSKEDLSIKNESDTTKVYNWVITDQDIEEVPSDVQIAQDEQEDFIKSVNLFDGYYKNSTDNTVVYIENKEKWSPIYDVNGTYTDKNGDIATIPAGFQVSEKKGETLIDEGLVIQDEEANQFIWIPVKDINDIANVTNGTDSKGNQNYQGKLYNFSSDEAIEMTNYGQGTTSYREPDTVSSYDGNSTYLDIIKGILKDNTDYNADNYASIDKFKTTMQEDYNAMIKSVEEYGGFYIGRYEMSRSSNDSTGTAQSKKDTIALTADDDSSNESQNGNSWYGLYAYGKRYTNSYDSVVSSMVWGSQYDAMMKWMQENGKDVTITIGDNRNTGIKTGTSETDIINNIYDLFGCHYEWTLEVNNTYYRVGRGGLYSSSHSPSYRNKYAYPKNFDINDSSRLSLYIK